MEYTTEEIAQMYSAALDSVWVLDNGQTAEDSDEEWADIVARNVGHLEIVVAKDFWTDEDLTPFHEAIAAHGEAPAEPEATVEPEATP